jgi:hypothetical protein
VYWVRRGLVLALALGMVFGIAHLLGGGGSHPQDDAARVVGAEAGKGSPSSTPLSTALSTGDAQPETTGHKDRKPQDDKTQAPPPEPSGPCTPSDIVATPKVRGAAHAGSPVIFRIKLNTLESPACTWRVSSSSLAMKLVSGSDRIWSSQDCPAAIPTADVVVRKDYPAKIDVRWHGMRSDNTCSRTTTWAQPGWYHAQAAAFGAEPTDVQFELQSAVRRTITPKPKPEPEKKSDKKAEKPTAGASDGASGGEPKAD